MAVSKLTPFRVPRFTLLPKKIAEIPFVGTVGGSGQLTMVSDTIHFSFVVRSIVIDFANDHNDLVLHYVLLSHNRTVSATMVPADTSAFSALSTTAFAIGDNRERKWFPNVEWKSPPSYVKVHINNLNVYAVNVKVSITVEEIE